MNHAEVNEFYGAFRKLMKSKPFYRFASKSISSPIGNITVHACELGVISVDFGDLEDFDAIIKSSKAAGIDLPGLLNNLDTRGIDTAKVHAETAAMQLVEYFSGNRTQFSVSLAYEGTEFQKAVWQALCDIPYGETRTYAEIAAQIGRPKAVRAVGQANRANPIAIIIPCHRVIGSSGALVGYAGSQVDLKSGLLELEQRVSSGCA